MTEWSITNLGPSLAGVDPESGSRRLGPGRWVVKITDAKVVQVGTGGTGRAIALEFEEIAGAGVQKDSINVHLPGRKPEAVEIGKKRLVSLLTHSDWPFEPDELGVRDETKVSSLIGRVVGLTVEFDATPWTTQKGETISGSNKPAKYGAYFNPETIGMESKPAQASVPSPSKVKPGGVPSSSPIVSDDEVPF